LTIPLSVFFYISLHIVKRSLLFYDNSVKMLKQSYFTFTIVAVTMFYQFYQSLTYTHV